MKRIISVAAVLLAGLLAMPALVTAAGIPGATVRVNGLEGQPAIPPAVTDAEGGFTFDGLAAGWWLLDVATADLTAMTQILFAVPTENAPAQLAGQVTAADGAVASLQVSAGFVTAGEAEVPPPEIEPATATVRLPPVWNFNWAHARGKIMVFVAGAGEALESVALSSATGSVESTAIAFDPVTGVARAAFPKAAAFQSLVPPDAVRGDVVPITVELTAASGVSSLETSIRLVGAKKKLPLGKRAMKVKRGPKR